MELVWILLGALIGVAAAQRRGFSVVAGIFGGALLGPLAVLMFFVSSTAGDKKKKCGECGEWVKAEAVKCRYCQSRLT